MKFTTTTIEIPAVEMTKEEIAICKAAYRDKNNESPYIKDWIAGFSYNEILFVGETEYRRLVVKD
jgi:hypothetical protein